MLALIGMVIVLAGVLGGFAMHHGPFKVLVQPSEYVIIGGAALGSTLISTSPPTLKKLVAGLVKVVKGSGNGKARCLAMLVTLYRLFKFGANQGTMALEPHVEKPEESEIFQADPAFLKDAAALEFFCDTVKLIIIGGVPDHQLAELADMSLETHEKEAHLPTAALTRTADALPGLGIVAAVLGIIITMQAIGGPPEEIGHKVAVALVGTFLGVLLAYGFVGPLAANLEAQAHDHHHVLLCLRGALLAFAQGLHPLVAVEFGRRCLPSSMRPTFTELETACRESGEAGS